MKLDTVYHIDLFINREGFWLAKLPGFGKTAFGDVSATPGEAVTSLLIGNGVEVNTGALVIEDYPDRTDR